MAREGQRLRSESVRQEILDTALFIGLEQGFEEVSIRKIIQKMKYSTGVVYYHFGDKQEIIDAIEAAQTQWLHGEIQKLIEQDQDIFREMEAVFRRVMRLAYEEPEKYNLIVLHKYSRQKTERPEWVAYLSQKFEAAMKSGLIREMDSEKAAFSVWSSFLGFSLMISRQKGITLDRAEELFRVQFDIILQGIRQL
jgi:AcrR family transcriptional regulator